MWTCRQKIFGYLNTVKTELIYYFLGIAVQLKLFQFLVRLLKHLLNKIFGKLHIDDLRDDLVYKSLLLCDLIGQKLGRW